MSFIDLLAALGFLLAVAVALDLSLRAPFKRGFAIRLVRIAKTSAGSSLQSSRFFDRVFGQRIFSCRSFLTTCAITVCTLVLVTVVTGLTSPKDLLPLMINFFPNGVSLPGCLILLVILLTTISGDYLSYAKTRVFIRTIASYPHRSFISVLLTGDFMASLTIFAIVFSVGLLISNIIVAYAVSPITSIGNFVPGVLERVSKRGALDNRIVDVARTSRVTEYFRRSDSANENFSYITYRATPTCFKPDEVYVAIVNTQWLAIGIARSYKLPLNPSEFNRELGAEVKAMPIRANACTQGISLIRQIDVPKLLSEISLTDLYLVSLNATLQRLVVELTYKFATFEQIDPFRDYMEFLQQSLTEKQARFLGWQTDGRDEALKVILRFAPYEKKFGAAVPFSVLAASSLGASAMFWMFLLVGFLSRIAFGARRMIVGFAPILRVRTAPFTSLAIAATSLCLGLELFFIGLSTVWKVLLSVT